MTPRYGIVEYTDARRMRFRIIETTDTCDGPRSRLTERVFEHLEQAQALVEEFLNPKEPSL